MPFTIETGKEVYKYYFENDPDLEPTHERDLFYIHDKINNKYDAHPGDGSSYDDPLTCLDDTLNFAKKIGSGMDTSI